MRGLEGDAGRDRRMMMGVEEPRKLSQPHRLLTPRDEQYETRGTVRRFGRMKTT